MNTIDLHQAGCSAPSNYVKRQWCQGIVRRMVVVNKIIVLILLLSEYGAVAATQKKTFGTFHVRSMKMEGSQNRRIEDEVRWSRSVRTTLGNGTMLRLVHRDARDSPLRSSSNTVGDDEFGVLFRRRLLRDSARVRALDSMISQQQPMTAGYHLGNVVAGPPLRSPVFSGLQFGSGEYFTMLSFGSPPTEVLVTIDTGSDLIWLQCYPCDTCYDQIDPIFNPANSNSYETVNCFSPACSDLSRGTCEGHTCQYLEKYGDGSFSRGDFAKETITLNSTNGSTVRIHGFLFGCGHDNEGLLSASGGLLGLGRGYLSFPSQIAGIVAPRFSYCLTDRFLSGADEDSSSDIVNSSSPSSPASSPNSAASSLDSSSSSASGYLFFGESESEDMKYTPMLHNPAAPTFYYVQLRGISVAEEPVGIPSSEWELDTVSGRGGVIIDSGTSISRLSSRAYTALRDKFRSKAKHLTRVMVPDQELFDTCYELWEGDVVPVVALQFEGGVDLVLPLDNIVIPMDESGSVYCLAFALSGGKVDLTIIGNMQQQGFRVEFDTEKGRVGFQDCF